MVFAIGEATTLVRNGKIQMPTEYHLRKKKLFGAWVEDNVLCISDEIKALKARQEAIFNANVDTNHNLHIDGTFNGCKAVITGCISTIQVLIEGGRHV
ncbi:MAG: hypothetical protein IK068_04010 [Lachnospiraceae bacterium]|jgi:hypothetical protein|nr:hypothetical protein [Lachnospiraceae bacterium]